MDALKLIAADSIKENKPVIAIGDTVRVDVKIREGDRERIQAFEGTVIAKRGSGVTETFTVRRISYGVGVERVFPVHSQMCIRDRNSSAQLAGITACTGVDVAGEIVSFVRQSEQGKNRTY